MKAKIGASAKYNTGRVRKQYEVKKFRTFKQAGATIRLIARRSIRKRKRASDAGDPPTTRGRMRSLKTAIVFDATEFGVVIGPRKSLVGVIGRVHEFGERYKGQRFDERPFMRPALEKALPRIPSFMRGR